MHHTKNIFQGLSMGAALFLATPVKAAPPNVIVTLADDLGMRDLSYFNKGQNETPNIDRLLAGGVNFNYRFTLTNFVSDYKISVTI